MGSGIDTNKYAQFTTDAALNASTSRIAQEGTNSVLGDIAQNGSKLAQTQLKQATNQNNANSAGIIASAKGINPAMAAREAGYNSANTGQQAANQAAETQAQTQMAALGQLSANQLQQQNMSTNQYLAQNNTLAGIGSANNAAGGQAAGQAIAGIGAAAALAAADGGMVPDRTPRYADGGGISQVSPGSPQPLTQNPFQPAATYFHTLSANASDMPSSQAGQMMQSAPKTEMADPFGPMEAILKAKKAKAAAYDKSMKENPEASPTPDDVGDVQPATPEGSPAGAPPGGETPSTGAPLAGAPPASPGATGSEGAADAVPSAPPVEEAPMSMEESFARGGRARKKVPALVSPGETYLRPSQVKAVAKGKANPLKVGERIPGTPKVAGNSYANDTVKKTLEPGGIMIPNSVMQSSDPAHNAYKFVQAVLAKQKSKGRR